MKNIASYVFLATTVFGLYSCNKELDALPKGSRIDKIAVFDQASAQQVLNGAYYAFANAANVRGTEMTRWGTNQQEPATTAGYLGDGSFGASPLEDNRMDRALGYWNESYVLISATNSTIKGVEELADSKFVMKKKSEILGEARFLRAYGHFKLLSYYGQWYDIASPLGVLIRDEPSTLGNISKARGSVKESYDFILSDLDYAIANAPETNDKFYATKWAAMVLKMRVLMCRGAASDYATIISLANAVMAGPYKLEGNPKDIFYSKGLSSEEVILGVQPQANQQTFYAAKSLAYASGRVIAKPKLKNLFANDPRKDWMVGNASTKVPNVEMYYFTKYIKQDGTPSQLSEVDYAIRLVEVHLLKAEAIVRSNGNIQDAKDIIHAIQSKSGITATINTAPYLAIQNAPNNAALLVEIYKETVKNLVAEDGMEWLALLRLPLVTITGMQPTLKTQNQFILAVPVSEFRLNPSFGEQNPGYPRS